MSFLAANETFYRGILRWNLGLDSPNKAALLLALLLLPLLAALLRARRGWVAWSCLPPAVAIGYAFIHTFSRGGFVALAAGSAILLVAEGRHAIAKHRIIPLLLLGGALAFALVGMGFASRLVRSGPAQDASVGNRLLIWKAAPGMMADAPGGWGRGHAGAAFMGWYQPLARRERYRTLVNSHLTWLVEHGWCERWLYAVGWLFALGLGGMRLKARGDPLPLALFVCFGTAAFFSSVAEEWYVWLIPSAALLPALKTFRGETPARRAALAFRAVAGGSILMGLFAACGHIWPMRDFPLHRSVDSQRITIGTGVPAAWIVFDDTTMGGRTYGRALRAFLDTESGKGRCIGIAARLSAVPADVRRLVLCGAAATEGPALLGAFPQLEEVRVLSPVNPRKWLSRNEKAPAIQVVCGSLAENCPADDMQGLKTVPGAGDFLPAWPQLAFTGW